MSSSLSVPTEYGVEHAENRVSPKIVAATVAGNTLEIYDFVIYAFFSVYIGRAFFPSDNPSTSLLLSVAVFGVGFFARPLGGIFIGKFADSVGRKPAMLLTIVLITIGTMGLALTPTYEQIGVAAPILIVICRLIQGLALGGEIGPATTYLIEAAPAKSRGLWGSWQLAGQGIASFTAGLVGLYLTSTLSPDEMQSWGWRIPFLLGLFLIPVAIYLRKTMPETLHTQKPGTPREKSGNIWENKGVIGLGIMLILATTVFTYLGTYMTTYAITTLNFAPSTAMGATVAFGAATFFFSLLGGWLSDRIGRKPVMLWPRAFITVIAVPAFWLLTNYPSPTLLFSVTALIAACTALSGTAALVAVPEMLPERARATGLSVSYAFTATVFGGTTQFVITWLLTTTGYALAPIWYVAALGVFSTLAVLYARESSHQSL